MAKYNGHKNYNHWNVSLWLSNDYDLYLLCQEMVARTNNRDIATSLILRHLPEKTPDGVKYTFSSVRAAIQGDW